MNYILEVAASCLYYLPSAQPVAKDTNVPCNDTIDRQAAIDALIECDPNCGIDSAKVVKQLPSAQREIIRCRDCRWWNKYSDTHGYCMAAKHGYWSEHWEITIKRTDGADWYCADAERGEES